MVKIPKWIMQEEHWRIWEEIILCKEAVWKILSKIKLKAEKEKNEINQRIVDQKYDLNSTKKEKCFRIVYNDEIRWLCK